MRTGLRSQGGAGGEASGWGSGRPPRLAEPVRGATEITTIRDQKQVQRVLAFAGPSRWWKQPLVSIEDSTWVGLSEGDTIGASAPVRERQQHWHRVEFLSTNGLADPGCSSRGPPKDPPYTPPRTAAVRTVRMPAVTW